MALEAELYKRFNRGDVLTDGELTTLHKHFHALYQLLVVSGPVFHLACSEAHRIERYCEDYIRERKR